MTSLMEKSGVIIQAAFGFDGKIDFSWGLGRRDIGTGSLPVSLGDI
jgi:hypothetical protein